MPNDPACGRNGNRIMKIGNTMEEVTMKEETAHQPGAVNGLQHRAKTMLDQVSHSKHLNNEVLSSIVGRGRSTVSEIRNGKKAYSEGVLNQIINRLSAYLPDEIRPTSQSSMLQKICEGCLAEVDLRMVTGDTGLGKTMVLKDFSANTVQAWYLKIGQSMTQTMFLKRVALAIGCKVLHYRRDHIFGQIGNRLDEKGRMVLLIDECEVLSMATLKVVKHLHNAFEGSLGIVVAGVPSLKLRLMRMGGIDAKDYQLIRPSNEYTTLFRRCKFFQLGQIQPSDVRCFTGGYGSVPKKVVNYLFKRCWNYDYLVKLLEKARRMQVDFSTVMVEDLDKITIY